MPSFSSSLGPPKSVWHRVHEQFRGRWRIRDLYGGLPLKLICYVPYQSLYMVTYDNAIHYCQSTATTTTSNHNKRKTTTGTASPSFSMECHHSSSKKSSTRVPMPATPWHTIVAAIAAEFTGCVIRVPMEATKMWVQSTVSPHSFAALKHFGECQKEVPHAPTGRTSPFCTGGGGATPRISVVGADRNNQPSSGGRVGTEGGEKKVLSGVGSGGTRTRIPSSSLSLRVAYSRMRALFIPQTLMHDIPYSICQWLAYEALRPWVVEQTVQQVTKSSDSSPHQRDEVPHAKESKAGVQVGVPPLPAGTVRVGVGGGGEGEVHFCHGSSSLPTTRQEERAANPSSSGSANNPNHHNLNPNDSQWLHRDSSSREVKFSSFRFFSRTAVAGGAAGFCASVLTIPLDHIRTRALVLEGQRKRGGGCGEAMSSKSTIWKEVIRPVYLERGISGFFRGGGWRVLWVTSNMALYFPVFEWLKHQL